MITNFLKNNDSYWKIYTGESENKNIKYNKFYVKPKLSNILIENDFTMHYPDNKKFAICLTHDIDEVHMPFSHNLLNNIYYLKNLKFEKIEKNIFWKYNYKNFKYNNFKFIINLEKKFDAKSTFFFLASNDDIKRYRYDVEDIKSNLLYLNDEGWEIGLHGSYYAYNNLKKIKLEKQILEKISNKKIIGYRNHYLKFSNPLTWELLVKANLEYDSTYAYSDKIGFKNGMCHPYIPYSYENEAFNICEIPLGIMDATLGKLHLNQSWEICKNVINEVEKNNGVLTILFHNDSLLSPYKDKLLRLYEKILKEGKERNAWLTSCEEVNKWWKKK